MLCYNCKKQDALPNRRLCQACLSNRGDREYQVKRESAHRLKQERLAAELCPSCSGKRPLAPGFKQCLICKAKGATRGVLTRQTRREADLCSRCGKKPALNGTMCEECRMKASRLDLTARNRLKETRISAGLCIQCKEPNDTPEFTTCSTCRAKRRDIAARKRLTSLQYSILERDGFICQLCGIDKYFHVHHIDGNGTGSPKPNDDPDNLITLCRRCHNAITILRATNKPNLVTYLILA